MKESKKKKKKQKQTNKQNFTFAFLKRKDTHFQEPQLLGGVLSPRGVSTGSPPPDLQGGQQSSLGTKCLSALWKKDGCVGVIS